MTAAVADRHPAGPRRRLPVPGPAVRRTCSAAAPRLVAVLAHVRDPGNAGTVLRCADAAGADAVVLTDASVDLYNPKSVRASAGSLFHLPVAVGVPVETAVARAARRRRAGPRRRRRGRRRPRRRARRRQLGGPTAWVFGNEAWGLPEETRALADAVVRVPIHGRAESLNLATAAAVCLYASARAQRGRGEPGDARLAGCCRGPGSRVGIGDVTGAASATPDDDLPDGLVVADERALVIVFNPAAARITGLDAGCPRSAASGGRAAPGGPGRPPLVGAAPTRTAGLPPAPASPSAICCCPAAARSWSPRATSATTRSGPVRRRRRRAARHPARRRTERSHAELIATVAHELRSPLTSVKGFTATLLAKWERFTDDQKRLMLETVDADANRVTRLIAELLDISRIDSGRLEVRRQPVDIAAAVDRHVAGIVAARASPPTASSSTSPPPLPELWADPDKIDQVLGNLLENAVRHGEGTVTIDGARPTSDERRQVRRSP